MITIKKKLLLLLVLSMVGSMLIAGFILTIIVKDNYEDSTKLEFNHYYDRARSTFKRIELDTQFYSSEIAKLPPIKNAVNLISEYSDIENYQANIYDEEKKNIARILLNYAKSSQLPEIRIYDKSGWLAAFSRPNSISMGIISFINGKPVIHISEGSNENWKVINDESLIPLMKISENKAIEKNSYIHNKGFVGHEVFSNIYRTYSDGKSTNIGKIYVNNSIGFSILNALSKGSQGVHGILLPNNKWIGDEINDVDITKMKFTSSLFNMDENKSLEWLDNNKYFISAHAIPLLNGDKVYLVSGLNRNIVNKHVNEMIFNIIVVFIISILILLPMVILFSRYSITSPIDKLVQAVKSLEDGEYKIFDTDKNTSYEINELAAAFNHTADKVLLREKELRTAHDNLEQRVEERTKELLYSEMRHSSLIDNVVDSVITINNKGIIISVNPATERMFGYNALDLIEKNIKALMPDPYQSEHDGYLSNYKNTHVKKIIGIGREVKGLRKDGTIFYIDLAITEMEFEGEQLFVGIIRDISERKLIANELLESKNMLQHVLDTIPVRVFWKDASLNYQGCNQLFSADAGLLSPNEIIGKSDFDLPWLDVAELYRHDDKIVMNSGKAKLNYQELQTTASGDKFWVETSKIPLTDANNEIVGILGIYQDITSRKNAEEALVKAKDDADDANKAKSEFLSSMSHELRTPMNAVLGFAQILELDKDTFSEDQNSSVQHILEGGYHLLHLIDEVLDLAKIESGKLDCDIKEIPLKGIIDQCSSLMNKLAEESNIQIDYGNPQDYTIMADPHRIKQVLINYLSNAIKYNRPNGHVTINYQAVEENRLRINVSDTGIGINKNDLELLFKPFTRVGDKSTNVEGTGIGLVISKELMTLMNGTVGASSKVGEGTTFWLEIKLGE